MNLSLHITGLIGEPDGDLYSYDWTTAQEIKDDIDGASNIDSIDLYINSIGGNAQHGFDMIKHIEGTGITPTVFIQGIAASMGSYITAYFKNRGSEIFVVDDSEFMYHSSRSETGGTAKELFRMAESAEKLDDTMAEEYAKAFGRDKQEIISEMEQDQWLSAGDLIDMGFAKLTENFSKLVASTRNENIYNRKQTDNNMADYTKIAAALGKEVDSGESALVAAAKELHGKVSDLEAKLIDKSSDFEALQAKYDKAGQDLKGLQAKAEVSEAQKLVAKLESELERKLSPADEVQKRASRFALKATNQEGEEKEDAYEALKALIKLHGAPAKTVDATRETDDAGDAYDKLKARCEKENISFEEGFKKYGFGGKK
jgi:ATP-dependent protease ClpP protease subunit